MIFNKGPQFYTPAYNPVLFLISSTYSQVLYFNIQVKDVDTNTRVINDRAYVSPITPFSAHYNISDIARDLVTWQINNDGRLFNPVQSSVRELQLLVSDYGVVGNTMSQLGATHTSSTFFVWNGDLPRHKFTDFDYLDYVLTNSTTSSDPIKFLTTKPNYSYVNNYSRDFLYYLKRENVEAHYVQYRELTATMSLLRTWTYEIISYTQSMMRLDVSPKALRYWWDNDNPDVPPTFLTPATYYSVHLENSAGATVSEVKYFKYEPEPDCGLDIVNILWQNSLGGIDSYQFIQPVQTRNVERFNIVRNPYQYDASGYYADNYNNIYHDRERVIHNNPSSEWKMWTRVMTDAENNWIAGILTAKNWWIELKNGRVYPCQLVESTYTINKQSYQLSERLQSQFTFRVLDEFIEDGQIYAGMVSIPTTTSTTTTTTTIATTTTTTTSTSTSTSTTTETTTVVTYYEFAGCGRGNTTGDACLDAGGFFRTFYSNCSTINVGCQIYTDNTGTKLTGFTNIYIDNFSWRISPASGIIQYIDSTQC